MTEPESFSQWSAKNALDKDPIDALREYTDYARMQYLRSGASLAEIEPQLRAGVEDKLKEDGKLREDSTAEERQAINERLFAPKSNMDFDAAVVQNYLALDDPDGDSEESKANSTLLRDYLAKKKYSPELAAPLEGAVMELLKDGALVRRARIAAVDRGEFEAVSVANADGTRSVYSGANEPASEDLPMLAEGLLRTGALDGGDLALLQDNYRKVFDGKGSVNRIQRASMFNEALDSLSQSDPEIAQILAGAASAAAKTEYAPRQTLKDKAIAGTIYSATAALGAVNEVIGSMLGLQQVGPTVAETAEYQIRQGDRTASELIREKLMSNEAFRKRFSEDEIAAFTNDRVLAQTDYKFDSTKPETGIRELSTGAVVIAPALLSSAQKLEDALSKNTALTEQQKEFARTQRATLLDVRVPQMLKTITASSDEAVSAYAVAKQEGKSDREFVEQWLSDGNNYSAFANTLGSVTYALGKAVADTGLGVAALLGSETATKMMLESQATQSRFAEYGSLFGDDFGIAREALNALPAVAVDLALTIGTAGAGRAVTAAARAGSLTARTAAKGIVAGALDAAATGAVRAATGASAQTAAALQAAGRSFISRAATTAVEQVLPVALPAFNRSASNTYVSIYGSLPESMTHAEKHKQSLSFALAAGVGTAAITAGLSALGAPGIEKLGVRTAAKGIDDLTYREAKLLFEAVKNEGKAVSDNAFQKALAAEVGTAFRNLTKTASGTAEVAVRPLLGREYRNLASGVVKGFRDEAFEEALDQSINMAIEDAALKRNRPVAEKLQQIWNAGLIGGLIGGGITTASQSLTPTQSARTKALQQRVSVLDGIAKRLSTNGAPQTAASVQRMLDAANAAAVASTKQDTAAAAAQAAKAPTTAVRTVAEQLEFKFDDPRGVPPADTRLADLVGERVYIGETGINGIAEIDPDTGEVVINFSKPTKVKDKPDVTRYVLGTKFQKATGVTLKPKIKTLTKPVGALPAGTRTFRSGKLEYVLPAADAVDKARAAGKPLLVLQRDENQRVVGVTVRGVALVASPTTTTDATITDPDLMREVLRLYPAPATPTGGFQLESGEQLEFDFNAPREVEQPETEEKPPLVPQVRFGVFALEPADQLELDFNVPEAEPELQQLLEDPNQLELDFDAEAPETTKTNLNALEVILAGDPVLNFLRSADPKRKGFAASVQQISDGEWTAAGDALEAAFDFVADLGDTEPLLTKAATDTLGPILFKYDTGTTIRKRAARQAQPKPARRAQGKTATGPAPKAETPPVAPEPTPTPEPEPKPAAKKAARKTAPAPAPEPSPAAKKAARKAPKPAPTKEQVLDEVGVALVKLEQALVKEGKLGARQLGDRKIAREINEKLTSIGFDPADTPEGFFANAVDAGDPSAFERLVGAFQWASGQPEPVVEPEPAAEPEPDDLQERLEALIADPVRRESLVGKVVQLRLYPDSTTNTDTEPLEIVGFDEGDILAVDPGTNKSRAIAYPLEEFVLESFIPYLEAGSAEPEAGAPEPAAKVIAEKNKPVSPDDKRIAAPTAESNGMVVFERPNGTRYQLLDNSKTPEEYQNLNGRRVLIPGYDKSNETGGFSLAAKPQQRDSYNFNQETPTSDTVYTASDYTGRSFTISATELFNQGATITPKTTEPEAGAVEPEPSTPPVTPVDAALVRKMEKFYDTVDETLLQSEKKPAVALRLAKSALDKGYITQRDYDSVSQVANTAVPSVKEIKDRARADFAAGTITKDQRDEAIADAADTRSNELDNQTQEALEDLRSSVRIRIEELKRTGTIDPQAGTLSMLAPRSAAVSGRLPGEPTQRTGPIKQEGAMGDADTQLGIMVNRVRNRGKDPVVELQSARKNINSTLDKEGLQLDDESTAAFDTAIAELQNGSDFESVLADLMGSFGYEKFGNVGGTLPMDTLVYDDLEGGMFPGDPALVVTHGYRFPGQSTFAAVIKAGVRPTPEGTLSMLAPRSAAVARHAELEAKFNAGTITPEETAEAQRLVEAAAREYERGKSNWFDVNDPTLGARYRGAEGYGVWMTRDGRLIPVGNHAQTAKEFFGSKNSDYALQDAFGRGWVILRAIKAGDYRWSTDTLNVEGEQLTNTQKKNITDWARQHGYELNLELRPQRGYPTPTFTGAPLDQRFSPQGTLSTLALPDSPALRQNVANIPAELQGMLPVSFALVADPNMDGALGYNAVTAPTTVFYNPNLVGSITIGLSRADALATLRTAVDHELGHAAAEEEFGQDGYAALAVELGEDKLLDVAGNYYSLLEPDFNLRAERIKKDRASGALPDWKIAAEWVRMEIERIANGRTSEQRMLFLRSRPSLLAKFIDALNAFVVRLRARFFEKPTTGTAASISNAARQLRKLRNGGYLPAPPKADPNLLGHAAELFGALERGSDQTLFTLPIGAATAAGKTQVDGLWKRIRKKFQNLPPEFRPLMEEQSGIFTDATDKSVAYQKSYERLLKKYPTASLDDIGLVLGRTDPTLDDAALARIQTEVDAFAAALPADMEYDDAEELITKKRDEVSQRERIASNTAFAAEQAAAEQRLRNEGHGEIADLVKRFRGYIDAMTDKYPELSVVIAENEGVYLMRTYRFFHTEGWALLAAGGLQPDGTQLGMFRGKEIDFGKLRANAAKTYEQDVIAEAAKEGVVLTAEQLRDKVFAKLDAYLEYLQKGVESEPSPSSNTLKKDMNRLLPKGNINKAILDLLGVVEDPLENAIRTMNAVGKLAAKQTFMRGAREMMLNSGLASTKQTATNSVLALGRVGDPSVSPLGELWTTPELAKALQAEFGVNGRGAEKSTDSLMREAGRVMTKAASVATTMKTLGSIGFYPRNIVSGQVLLLGAQGILPVNSNTTKAWGLATRAYWESWSRTDEQAAAISRMIELQVLKDDTQGRVAVDMMRGLVTNSEQDLDALLEEFQEAASGSPKRLMARLQQATGKGYGTTIEFLASLNNIADGAVKAQAYMFELDVLKKDAAARLEQAAQNPNPNVLAALNAELEERAADKVKSTFPSHSRQFNWVKSLNQTSVGMVFFPFARWKTEVFRTMYNTPRLAIKEIREGGPAERARGFRRMFGFLSTMAVGGKTLGIVYSGIFSALGDDEDKEGQQERKLTDGELYALREALPDWQRSHAIYTRLIGGEVQVIDLTAMTPYAQLTDIFGIAIEGLKSGEGVNSKRIASYVATQLIGTQIAANAASEVLNNRDDFGQPIYNETDNLAEVFYKSFAHYGKGALKPGAYDFYQRATRSGEQNKFEIVLGELLGARPRSHKLSEIEYRAFRGVKKMLDDSAQIKAALVTGRKLDDEEVVGTLKEHQEALNRTQRKLAKTIDGLKSMGSTRGALFGSAKAAGFSAQRIELAEQGKNYRWVGNQAWLEGIYRNMTRTGEDDPMNRINLIRRTLSDLPPIYGVLE